MKRFLIVIVLLALLMPGVLMAQEEGSLESLIDRFSLLVTRVEEIERRLTPPTTSDGECLVYLWGSLDRATITEYINTFNEEPGTPQLRSIFFDPSTGLTRLYFQEGDYPTRYVSEFWRDCDFVSHSGWIERW